MAGRELQELGKLVSGTVRMRTLFWTLVFIRTILKSAVGRGQMPVGLQRVNDHLLRVERAFTRPRGLSERPWFNNLVYAPSDGNLYAAELLPGILGAMRGGSEGVLAIELDDLATSIRAATVELVAASVSLRAAGDSRLPPA
jgi:hypothetical protein